MDHYMLRWLPDNVSFYGQGTGVLVYLIYYMTATAFSPATVSMIVFLLMHCESESRRAAAAAGAAACG